MLAEAKDAWQYGVRSFVLFPKVDDNLKSNRGEEAYNPNGIVPRAVSMLKEALPDSIVCTDVALDPYSSMGHDGIVEDGRILNDETIEQLCKQSVMQARAGCDVVAPSDMMDGRVGAIRDALDAEGFADVSILAYTAKYASAYYGPFRDALDSHPGFGDKKTYQQDPANGREALHRGAARRARGRRHADGQAGPAVPRRHLLRLKQTSNLPIAAYHVSGEYSMLKAAAERGWLDERKVALETAHVLPPRARRHHPHVLRQAGEQVAPRGRLDLGARGGGAGRPGEGEPAAAARGERGKRASGQGTGRGSEAAGTGAWA